MLVFLTILPGCNPSDRSTSEENIQELFKKRLPSVVAIKYFIQHEESREARMVFGIVVNDEGLLVTQNAVPNWVPNAYIKEIKVFPIDKDSSGFSAKYLGQKSLFNYHYFRMEENARQHFTPVSQFKKTELHRGDKVWGIGAIEFSDNFFQPFFASSLISFSGDFPTRLSIARDPLASEGCPVFDFHGAFAGWAVQALSVGYIIQLEGESIKASLTREGSSQAFLPATDFYNYLLRDPDTALSKPRAWLGIVGFVPVSKETAKFLGLGNQGALIISNITANSPVEKAGIQAKDIIIAVDDVPLKKFINNPDIATYFRILVDQKKPGETIALTVQRENEQKTFEATLVKAPKIRREAKRQYFRKLGLTMREFVYDDAVENQIYNLDTKGVVAQFIRFNSPVAEAELQPGDWIQEIDGKPIENYEEAIEQLEAIINNPITSSFVLLIERKNETKVLRIKFD